MLQRAFYVTTASMLIVGCLSPEPEGLKSAPAAETTVKFDFFADKLPDIPLPNDIATRYDAESATGRRINASMLTPSEFNSNVRRHVDQLDGWGLFQQISIPFTGPLDVQSILKAHRDADYDTKDDVVYLVNIDRDSENFGKVIPLDMGQGNYPHTLERLEYWKNDTRNGTLSILLEETNEDTNNNGKLDLGDADNPSEDTDADGVLDKPNYIDPAKDPAALTVVERVDQLMTFYERETNTLLARPMIPLKERTTYAVIVTRRLLDEAGNPVGSPFPYINHETQTEALQPLPEVLPDGLAMDDVAFAFTFTTQTLKSDWIAVRDGLYGHGPQAHLAEHFPAKIDSLSEIRVGDLFSDVKNPYIMHTENWIDAFALINSDLQGADPSKEGTKALTNSHSYVDYMVIGQYTSPQLFERHGPAGEMLRWNDQSWPPDLDRKKVSGRAETVHFWLFIPRREVSARGEGGQVPVAILGHGYTGNRFDAATFGGFMASHGIATIAIDNVSHGIGLDEETAAQAQGLMSAFGLGPLTEAILTDRSWDQNGDGIKDSGADFWSTYLFHTRDVVRQTALDYMQLVRVIRSFDGKRTWDLDVNKDGKPDLAGDFDGDGIVDIGHESTMGMIGGSLGGMMSTYMGSVEPEIKAVFPIAAGGGLTDLGVRSQQSGVREAFILRTMCPLFTGSPDPEGDGMILEQIVPDLNDTAELRFATVDGIEEGDAVRVFNLNNGEIGCANVQADGTWRATVESDLGDKIKIVFYDGPALNGDKHCGIRDGFPEKLTIDTVKEAYDFQATTYAADSALIANAEGFGMRRSSPDLRRLFGLGQLIADPADPATLAPHMRLDPIHYPGTGQKTGSHMLLLTTAGDMNVPVSGGMSIARAADLISWDEVDERYGVPVNQVLIDQGVAEAAHTVARFTDGAGNPVNTDVENFSENGDLWKDDGIPRLDPPLRSWGEDDLCDDSGCGYSGAIFPFPQPTGQHGFALPGTMTDWARKRCAEDCTTEPADEDDKDPCKCAELQTFDIGYYFFNMAGRYLRSGGKELATDMCNSRNDCDYVPEAPQPRSPDALE